jgi:hypothetical protein
MRSRGRDSAEFLPLLDFVEGLAVDTQGGRRARLEALDADLHAAGVAEAVIILFDALDGRIDLLDQLALAIAGTQFEAEFLFLRRAIRRVRESWPPRPSCA